MDVSQSLALNSNPPCLYRISGVKNLIGPYLFDRKTRLDPSVRSCAKVVVIPEKFRKISKRLGLLQDTNQSFGYWCKVQLLKIMHIYYLNVITHKSVKANDWFDRLQYLLAWMRRDGVHRASSSRSFQCE